MQATDLPQIADAKQKKFETIYRGRQGPFYHLSYMRLSKVLLALRALRCNSITLKSQSVFDYGFGAGTFFLFCPRDCQLSGVEQDSVVCEEVTQMLFDRGYRQVELREIDIGQWAENPLLQKEYDLFLCSHVLEHLPDPPAFLRAVKRCLKPTGIFLGLVPLNERAANPHHLHKSDRSVVEGWARDSGYELAYYEENDPFLYWIQPLYASEVGWRRYAGQIIRLVVGIPSRICGERIWYGLLARLTLWVCKPTQAVFILRRVNASL